jgi:hypothetical protein
MKLFAYSNCTTLISSLLCGELNQWRDTHTRLFFTLPTSAPTSHVFEPPALQAKKLIRH